MTDNDIIKALPNVAYAGHSCSKCKFDSGKGDDRCGLKGCKITRNALDLINRQKAEIERLRAECGNQSTLWSKHYESIFETARETAKAEAIKEFAEDIQEEISDAIHSNYNAKEEKEARCKKLGIPANLDGGFLQYCDGKIDALSGIASHIEHLVKEMVGDNDEKS